MEHTLTQKRYFKALQELYTQIKRKEELTASTFTEERKISRALFSNLISLKIIEKVDSKNYLWIADRHPDIKMVDEVIEYGNQKVRESAAKISDEEKARRKADRKARKLKEKLDEARKAKGEEVEEEDNNVEYAERKDAWIEEMRWRAKNNMLHQPTYMKTHKGDFIKMPMKTAKHKEDPELKVLDKVKNQQGKATKVKIEITYYYE